MIIENLQIDEVNCFENNRRNGVIISWSANIGFGELTLYHRNEDNKWKADTECMCPKGFPCFSIFCEDCPFNDTWWERDYHECFKPNWEEENE